MQCQRRPAASRRREDLGCAGALSQQSPLLALPDPGEDERVGGQACDGDVRVKGEQDRGGP